MTTILRDASANQVTRSIVDNYHISWSKVLKVFDQPSPTDLFGVDGFISGIPYMMMNSLFDGRPAMTIDDVSAIIGYFKDKQLPLMWFLSPEGQESELDGHLDTLGIELATMRVPGMVVDLTTVDQEQLRGRKNRHNIEPIDLSDPNTVISYADIFMQAFEVDQSIAPQMQRFASAFPTHPTSSHYFVNDNHHPVATASVVFDAGVAGIYNVATLPDHQRQGMATSLMATLMLDAIEQGYQYSILHSSERGKVVYERLGYEVDFWFKRYLLRPGDVGLDP